MYKLFGQDESDGVTIGTRYVPANTENKDWKKYLSWKDDGNTPETYRTAEEEKEIAIKKLRDDKWNKVYQGLVYGDVIIDMDPVSFLLLDSTITKILSGVISSARWKCRDRKRITIDSSNAAEILSMGIKLIQDAFDWEEMEEEKILE